MSNANTIIWIDDRDDDMEQIARGAFGELWKFGIFNKTVFLGNHVREVSKDACQVYRNIIKSLYHEVCKNQGVLNPVEGQFNKELFELNKKDCSNLGFQGMATCISENSAYKAQTQNIMNNWESITSLTDAWAEKNKEANEGYTVDCFFNLINNPSQFVYALDVVLLKGDEEKLNCDIKDSLPVLSMELYHYITTKLESRCVLYSKYTYYNRLANNWKELYAQQYNVDDNSLYIMSREGLYQGSIKQSYIECLKNMFGKEEKKHA